MRKNGFYWVQTFSGTWQVGEWYHNGWFLPGWGQRYFNNYFKDIIEKPIIRLQ